MFSIICHSKQYCDEPFCSRFYTYLPSSLFLVNFQNGVAGSHVIIDMLPHRLPERLEPFTLTTAGTDAQFSPHSLDLATATL